MSMTDVLTPQVTSVLLSNFVMSFIAEALFSLSVSSLCLSPQPLTPPRYPIFAFTPTKSGGLGLDEATIGLHLGFRALLSIPTMALYPKIDKRFGTLRFYQFLMLVFPFVIVCLPILNTLAVLEVPSFVMNAGIVVFFVLWSFCGLVWREWWGSGLSVRWY